MSGVREVCGAVAVVRASTWVGLEGGGVLDG